MEYQLLPGILSDTWNRIRYIEYYSLPGIPSATWKTICNLKYYPLPGILSATWNTIRYLEKHLLPGMLPATWKELLVPRWSTSWQRQAISRANPSSSLHTIIITEFLAWPQKENKLLIITTVILSGPDHLLLHELQVVEEEVAEVGHRECVTPVVVGRVPATQTVLKVLN